MQLTTDLDSEHRTLTVCQCSSQSSLSSSSSLSLSEVEVCLGTLVLNLPSCSAFFLLLPGLLFVRFPQILLFQPLVRRQHTHFCFTPPPSSHTRRKRRRRTRSERRRRGRKEEKERQRRERRTVRVGWILLGCIWMRFVLVWSLFLSFIALKAPPPFMVFSFAATFCFSRIRECYVERRERGTV